ncbi:MAG: GNAT family N-acetyltransferase [Lachnospiraceae bacterium]|nr:GNAT family N-acetyltransferase [Lachnospiraceae bacterium]
MIIEKYIAGNGESAAQKTLASMIKDEKPGVSYADMLRYRVSGKVADRCNDIYYIAHQDGKCLSRLWNGWGRHDNSIGNFGNFVTIEEVRGKGIGKKMLEVWFEDLQKQPNPPLGLFCTANTRVAKLYLPYGFRPAILGQEYGSLYMPIGNSPENFHEFCDMYYTPTNKLIRRPADIEWRHEIDCLLKFALIERGLSFGMLGVTSMEEALLYSHENAEMLFTENGRCVGWIYKEQMQVYPTYENVEIISL